jgi:hypothetical protein
MYVSATINCSRMFSGPYDVAYQCYMDGDPLGGFHDKQSIQNSLFAIDAHLESISDFISKMKLELPV